MQYIADFLRILVLSPPVNIAFFIFLGLLVCLAAAGIIGRRRAKRGIAPDPGRRKGLRAAVIVFGIIAAFFGIVSIGVSALATAFMYNM